MVQSFTRNARVERSAAPGVPVDYQALLAHGRELAAVECRRPDDADAIWSLMCEAVATLRALPDREVAWLRAAERAHHPETLAEFADLVGRLDDDRDQANRLRVRPSPAAIDRVPVVMPWFALVPRRRHRLKRDVLLAWAAGNQVTSIARWSGLSRQTIYAAREVTVTRVLQHVAPMLRPDTKI